MKPNYRVKKRRKVRKKRPPSAYRQSSRKAKGNFFRRLIVFLALLYVVLMAYVVGRALFTKPKAVSEFLAEVTETESRGPSVSTTESFIQEIVPIAQEMQADYQVLPSIIISQAILESSSGQSELGQTYHNLFGIKAYGEEEHVTLKTQEFVEGKWIEVQGRFRVYQSWRESIHDHSLLFVNGVTWNEQLYRGVIEATDYQAAAKALQKAGYATDPTYAEKIVGVIELYQLDQYDTPR